MLTICDTFQFGEVCIINGRHCKRVHAELLNLTLMLEFNEYLLNCMCLCVYVCTWSSVCFKEVLSKKEAKWGRQAKPWNNTKTITILSKRIYKCDSLETHPQSIPFDISSHTTTSHIHWRHPILFILDRIDESMKTMHK